MSAQGLAPVTAAQFKAIRQQEKVDVNDLNSRLRNYVKLQQSKEDDYQRMIKSLHSVEAEFEQQMEAKDYQLRQLHDAQQSHRLVARGQIADQENRARGERLRCDELYSKNRNVASDIAVLDQRAREIDAETGATQATLDNTKAALASTSERLMKETQNVAQLNADLGRAKIEHDAKLREQSRVDVNLKDAQEKLTRYIEQSDNDINNLKTELQQRGQAEARIEQELRSEYQAKLEDFINSRRKAHQAEKEEWMKIFRDEYARKISAYRNANEDYAAQIAQLRSDRVVLADKVDDLDVKIQNIKRDIVKFTSERDRFGQMVDENNSKINALRGLLRQKTDEFDEMLKFKENLENEIQEYWSILGGEERRLGFRGNA